MSHITIVDLEVFWKVGVPDEERSKPQRLLISVDMTFDFTVAANSDRPNKTIDYAEVVDTIQRYGEGKEWKLIEKLATGVGTLVLAKFSPQAAEVEVKKFPIPQARYVSVTWSGEKR